MTTTEELEMDSPLGTLRIGATDRGVCGIAFVTPSPDRPARTGDPDTSATSRHLLKLAEEQLREYFAGDRSSFSVPLDLSGTGFQRAVWRQLVDIPFGRTTTYGELAAALGSPGAYQAVGSANGRNPVAIMVPCHRVVGRKGKLTGYAGGIDRKQWLLRHEGGTLL